MDRRKFIQSMMYSGSLLATGGLGLITPFRQAHATHINNVSSRTLVNTMLVGGADLRHLFVPHPSEDPLYKDAFWEARKGLYQTNAATTHQYPDYESVYSDAYKTVVYNNFSFGIHKNAQWLIDQFESGNVAIVCNVLGSDNRRHDHSQLIMHTGDVNADQYIYDRDGWGGRFVNAIDTSSNILALNHDVSIFCNGVTAGNRLQNVVHMRNSRNFALPGPNANVLSDQSILARSLKSYYGSKGEKVEDEIREGEIDKNWPFRRFFQHEHAIRTFGDLFEQRLEEVQPNLPYPIRQLKTRKDFYNRGYATEIANLYDSMIAADIVSMRCAFMEYGGWDSHRNQRSLIDNKIMDIFGDRGGLDTLTNELDFIPGANENLSYVFTSDFGRQLAVNGDHGTDHGRGTYMIVVGRSVNGGIYGDMFPKREYQPESNTELRSPFEIPGRDIKGQTSYQRVLSACCDWVEPNTGSTVFPNVNNTIQESNVDLSVLFKSGFGIRGTVLRDGVSGDSSGDITFPGTSINAVDSNGVIKTAKVNPENGVYWLGGLSDGNYDIVPVNSDLTFTPPKLNVNVAAGNVLDANFSATHNLSITAINISATPTTIETNPNIPPGDYTIVRALGYGFTPGQTEVTIGGNPVNLVFVFFVRFLYLVIPVDVNPTGEIVVTTPTETYTHDVLYENIAVV